MTTSSIGLIAGLLLAIAVVAGGFPGFILAVALGALGYLVGGHFDGELDLRQVLGRRGRG